MRSFCQRQWRVIARPLIELGRAAPLRKSGTPSICGNRLMTVSSGGRGSDGWMALAAKVEARMQGMAIEGSKRIYLYNLKKKLASRSEAFGLEEMFVSRVKETYEVRYFLLHWVVRSILNSKGWQGLFYSNQNMLSDSRSQYHLQTSCLVLASYRILTGQLRLSHDDSITLIQTCMGDSNSFLERMMRRFPVS